MLTQTLPCSSCGSTDLIGNGHAKNDVMHDACLRLFLHAHNKPSRHRPRRIRLK